MDVATDGVREASARARTARPDGEQSPVMAAGEVLGTNIGYELLVGYTRLGNLLGLLDRQEISEVARHLVWVGNIRLPSGGR